MTKRRARARVERLDDVAKAAPALRARVLLVDDDERNLMALREVLSDVAEVACADSGEQALRMLLKDRFAVILMDVLMPGLDGYETARLIRAREQSRDTPIIFLTAINKEDAHMLRGYDLGAVDYVFKPFEPTAVRSKVSVFVSLHEKSLEIERKAASERQLLREMLKAEQDRAKAADDLRQSELRQSLVVGSLPLAVYTKESIGAPPQFVAGNLRSITGYDAADFLADPGLWASRVHPEDRDRATHYKVASDDTREFRWLHADETYRWLLDRSVPVSEGGEALVGTLLDVSEQRRIQEQLQQAQKMEAIGKLTGGVAHDFNNLLAAVLSGLSLIRRRAELNVAALGILEMTEHAAEQGKLLVNRLVAFSRRQQLEPQVVDLRSISRSLDAMLNPMLGGRVTLSWDLRGELWSIYVDPSQLELALMNLVINGRDAMRDSGSILVTADNRTSSASSELPGGEYVVIGVRDEGTGIPPDILAKVVEPFFTTKEVGKGSGLGLSMAYGFAKQSGGTLRIESRLGVGTVVELWLPRSTRRATAFGDKVPTGDSRRIERPGAHILLVDDSTSLRELTQIHLLDEGYQVTSASGAAEALELIAKTDQRFDVIVTDFAMPKISGIELIRRARELHSTWPAVMITGYADAEALVDRPNNITVLSKPFSTKALVEAIENSMSLESATQAVDGSSAQTVNTPVPN